MCQGTAATHNIDNTGVERGIQGEQSMQQQVRERNEDSWFYCCRGRDRLCWIQSVDHLEEESIQQVDLFSGQHRAKHGAQQSMDRTRYDDCWHFSANPIV